MLEDCQHYVASEVIETLCVGGMLDGSTASEHEYSFFVIINFVKYCGNNFSKFCRIENAAADCLFLLNKINNSSKRFR